MPTSLHTDLISTIESAVAERSLLQHPFYLAWTAGKLTKDHLAGYAKEYYWAVKHVPAVMEAIEKNIPASIGQIERATFAKNTKEEREHIELWKRFASALGITQKELEEYEPTETVKDAVASIVGQAEKGFEEGVAAMYAFECDLPAISQSKIDGLIEFYGFDKLTTGGMKSSDVHAYFQEHLAEEKHLCFWRNLLSQFPAEKRECALRAAENTVSAQNKVLDGVVERYLPEMVCSA